MGVYIKDMKMPRSCYNCKLDLRTDTCSAFLKWKKEHPYSIKRNDRLPDCPLVEVPEPHGRLIDVDEICLEEAIIYAEEIADRCAVTDGNIKCEIEHRQLAEWLKELKERREKDEQT